MQYLEHNIHTYAHTHTHTHTHTQLLTIPYRKAKINNMLVSGNMTPQKMGRKVGKTNYFKKIFCPIKFYLMTHLFPTAQLKNRGVEDQGKKIFFFIFSLIQ